MRHLGWEGIIRVVGLKLRSVVQDSIEGFQNLTQVSARSSTPKYYLWRSVYEKGFIQRELL